MRLRRVAVFCGSSSGRDPVYAEAARSFGAELGRRGLGLVYGGGNVGLMGVLADAALAAGSEVIGVIPRALEARELAHPRLGENLRVVESMHERKALMAELASAFVMLPGGFGTYDEFCEILTWAQLGIHQKACGVLDVKRFYRAMLEHFDVATREGFVSEAHRRLVLEADTASSLLDALEAFEPAPSSKWEDRGRGDPPPA